MVPAIGLSILGAWAIAQARSWLIPVAVALAGLYFMVSITETHVTEKYFYARARKIKYLVTALESLPKADAENKILLSGVDNDLFWSCFFDDPFRLIGITEIYLAPGSEKGIDTHQEWGGISRFVISPSDAYVAISHGHGKIYELVGRQLRDLTPLYLPALAAQYSAAHADFVDVGDPTYQSSLGPTWYQPERGFRWMPKTATVKIAGPRQGGQILEITGYCPALLVDKGPLEVRFRADGIDIGKMTLHQPDQDFKLRFTMPPQLAGRPTLELEIEVGRTVQAAGDQRPLGLIFGTFTMK
jgi:hypothetical protein